LISVNAWVVTLVREQISKEQGCIANNLVFRTEARWPSRIAFRQVPIQRLLRSLELPAIRLYDLRHTVATISLAAGCFPEDDQRGTWTRQRCFSLDVYSHVLPHMQDGARKSFILS
jgi:hypothetical protein